MAKFAVGARLVGDVQVLETLARLANAGEDLSPLLRRIGGILLASTRANFAAGGRPTWKPRRQNTGGGTVLVRSRKLLQSLKMEVGRDTVRVGSTSWLGPIHQFGATIHVPQVDPKKQKALRFFRGGRVFAATTRAHTATIPARPFLLMQETDKRATIEEVRAYLEERARG